MDSALTKQLIENNDNMLAVQAQIVQATVAFQNELAEYQKTDAELRAAIVAGMEQSIANGGSKTFENELIKLTYVAPQQRKGVDTARLTFEHPELAAKYEKITHVKSQVRIKLK